jgi:hypothetical protein
MGIRMSSRVIVAHLSIIGSILLLSISLSSAEDFREFDSAPSESAAALRNDGHRDVGGALRSAGDRRAASGSADNGFPDPRVVTVVGARAQPEARRESPLTSLRKRAESLLGRPLTGVLEGDAHGGGFLSALTPSKVDMDRAMASLLGNEDSPNSRPGPHWKMGR